MHPPILINRLQKELSDLERDPPPGITCYPKEDDMTQLESFIRGPPDSPYENGQFKLEIQIPQQYPFEPPQIRFKTSIYHPNIDESGRICADILKKGEKGGWKPALNITTTLLLLSQLLAYPNPDDPLDADIAREYQLDYPTFKMKAMEYTEKYATGNPSAEEEKVTPKKEKKVMMEDIEAMDEYEEIIKQPKFSLSKKKNKKITGRENNREQNENRRGRLEEKSVDKLEEKSVDKLEEKSVDKLEETVDFTMSKKKNGTLGMVDKEEQSIDCDSFEDNELREGDISEVDQSINNVSMDSGSFEEGELRERSSPGLDRPKEKMSIYFDSIEEGEVRESDNSEVELETDYGSIEEDEFEDGDSIHENEPTKMDSTEEDESTDNDSIEEDNHTESDDNKVEQYILVETDEEEEVEKSIYFTAKRKERDRAKQESISDSIDLTLDVDDEGTVEKTSISQEPIFIMKSIAIEDKRLTTKRDPHHINGKKKNEGISVDILDKKQGDVILNKDEDHYAYKRQKRSNRVLNDSSDSDITNSGNITYADYINADDDCINISDIDEPTHSLQLSKKLKRTKLCLSKSRKS